ncbi:MAG: hypothetical protein U0744_20260 [Gemmataceae bacterium]
MWKPAFAATAAALAFAIAAPAEAGPLPKIASSRQIVGSSIFNKSNIAALNPQPLPPRWSFGSLLNAKAINPQPLPPRWNFNTLNSSSSIAPTSAEARSPEIPVATNPLHVPNIRPGTPTTLR